MSERVTWGVIGTARIATTKVIPSMRTSDRLTVSAICSRDAARAERAASGLGIERAYGSYEELLADPDIEVIYNPLPNHLHVTWTLKAMEAGKHVLCEKPIALSAEEARTLIDARERTGMQVAEAFMVRQHPQWLKARDIVDAGELGEVRLIHTLFSYFLTDPANVRNQADIGGGGLYDIGCYAIATARFVFGAEPERVVALLDRDPAMQTDRLTSALIDFGEGRRLVFSCSTQLVPAQEVQILGERKRLTIEVPFNADPAAETRLTLDDGSVLGGGAAETLELPAADQYRLQAERFGEAVRGVAPLAFPIEDAVSNMRVIDALFASARSGGWERP